MKTLNKDNKTGEKMPKGIIKRQIYVSAVANLLQLMQGCVLPISSIILPQLQDSESGFSLTKEQGSWFASLYCFGYLFGAIVGGFQSEFFGRRVSLIIDSFLAVIGLSILFLSQSYPLFLVGRLLCGHSSGSGTVTIPIYTSEISDPHIRGATGSFLILFYFFGYAMTTILGTILPWRTAIGIVLMFPALAIVLLYFVHGSPVWLLRHGKEDKAMKSLLYFHGSETAAKKEKEIILKNILQKNQNNEKKGSFREEFDKKLNLIMCPSFWKPFLIIFIMLPLLCEWSGFPMIAFYLVTVVDKIHVPLDPFLAASILSIIRLIASGLALIYISRMRRRVLFHTCTILMIIGAMILALNDYLLIKGYYANWELEDHIFIKWLPAIGILILYIPLSSGFYQIIYMIQGELFPADTRAFGGGIIGIFDGLGLFGSSIVGFKIFDSYGAYVFFGYLSVMLCLLVSFSFIFLPETHGKHLSEIENFFLKKNDKKNNNDRVIA